MGFLKNLLYNPSKQCGKLEQEFTIGSIFLKYKIFATKSVWDKIKLPNLPNRPFHKLLT